MAQHREYPYIDDGYDEDPQKPYEGLFVHAGEIAFEELVDQPSVFNELLIDLSKGLEVAVPKGIIRLVDGDRFVWHIYPLLIDQSALTRNRPSVCLFPYSMRNTSLFLTM